MWKLLKNRLDQGYRTQDFPILQPLPKEFRGRPKLYPERCLTGCVQCDSICPTEAIKTSPLELDLAKCVFCGACEEACPQHAIEFTSDYSMAASRIEDLRVVNDAPHHVDSLKKELLRLFGRSLKLREVSAGSCNGCDLEIQALGNIVFDWSRFGIQIVASPRHADGLIVTGPVSRNMELALRKTYEALADPRLVIAVGTCALSGGVFAGSPEVGSGVAPVIPVDLYIPGCPPHPLTILDGVLQLLNRLK
jgi:Ni,Fe-hydrogenase III small subunit/NAD-dependent dihydropyrimidine dehydrogenase PreA subunit